MRACPLVKSVLYLLFVTASSVQSRCPGAQLSCLSRSSPSLVLCIEKDDLCSDGGVVLCQEGALGNITLQCQSLKKTMYSLLYLCTSMTFSSSDMNASFAVSLPAD